MLAMTDVPSKSTLPRGAFDPSDRSIALIAHPNIHSNSVISPLALPRPIAHSYFDSTISENTPPPDYIYSSSHTKAPGPAKHLSLNDNPISTPPKTTVTMASPNPRASSRSPSRSDLVGAVLSPTALLQLQEEYHRRSQQSWRTERESLEASRARAETRLQQERAWMEEERKWWAKEVEDWKRRAHQAEEEVAKLSKAMIGAEGWTDNHGLDGTRERCSVGGRSGSSSSKTSPRPPSWAVLSPGTTSHSGFRSSSSGSPRTAGRTTATYRSMSDDSRSSTFLGTTIPESNPFIPLDPRMQGPPSPSFPTVTVDEAPSIDIHEVMPELEGIRVKATAFQRPTFNEEGVSGQSPGSATAGSNEGSADASTKLSPAKMAELVVQAPEHHRLTMHAGHTPNHSVYITQLPTIESSAVNTAGSSGASTPTRPDEQGAQATTDGGLNAEPVTHEPAIEDILSDPSLKEEVLLEPSDDDPALKGPLCLRNRPAADEAFLRRLSDKLEEIKASDSTPSVLSELPPPNAQEESADLEPASHTNKETRHDDDEESSKEIEEDVPLKLRQTSNFGLPFGQSRSSF
ncbi:hypothetical protein GGS20DRAFT_581270 [Poronia punctata]|nr:hypothetical protein GGS20DRAFT_581270 [Poronia punctata]